MLGAHATLLHSGAALSCHWLIGSKAKVSITTDEFDSVGVFVSLCLQILVGKRTCVGCRGESLGTHSRGTTTGARGIKQSDEQGSR